MKAGGDRLVGTIARKNNKGARWKRQTWTGDSKQADSDSRHGTPTGGAPGGEDGRGVCIGPSGMGTVVISRVRTQVTPVHSRGYRWRLIRTRIRQS